MRTHTNSSIEMQKAMGHTNAPQQDPEAEFQEEIAKIEPKIAQGTVTKAEADHLHSLEARAHGHTEKGGITAAAQSVVAKRERKLSLSSGSGTVSSQKRSSMSPQQKSRHDREENLRKAEDDFKTKVEEGDVNKAEADHLHSLEDRAHGHTKKGGMAASAQSVSARRNSNSGHRRPRTSSHGALSPQEQSHHDKEENLHRAEVAIRPKIEDGTVTADEASKLHSCEMRAHGHTEKGGMSAKAQAVVAKRRYETLSDVSNAAHQPDTDTGYGKELPHLEKKPERPEENLDDVPKTDNEAH